MIRIHSFVRILQYALIRMSVCMNIGSDFELESFLETAEKHEIMSKSPFCKLMDKNPQDLWDHRDVYWEQLLSGVIKLNNSTYTHVCTFILSIFTYICIFIPTINLVISLSMIYFILYLQSIPFLLKYLLLHNLCM